MRLLNGKAARLSLAVASILGCTPSNTASVPDVNPEVSPNQVFQLGPGQAARIPSLSLVVRFDTVLSESRCPTDVVCVWAGNAAVQLTLLQTGAAERRATINSTLEPRRIDATAGTIELMDLTPHPDTRRRMVHSEYRAHLIARSK
ncbi:MAG: hypothetical protein ACT4P7_23675 [Gemmatimonadaceae bacterium]